MELSKQSTVKESNNNDQLINDLVKRLSNLEKELNNKLDCDIFDNEVQNLRALIGNIEPSPKAKVIQNVVN